MSTSAPVAEPGRAAGASPTDVVLLTGISGSGKSVALHALEDAGYFCVDNLPPELLREFVRLERQRATPRVAVAVDVRSAGSLPQLLPLVRELRGTGQPVRVLFLDAGTEALVRRFSETRRPHPLTAHGVHGELARALTEAIEIERELLAEVRESATVIDTSQLRPAQLGRWVRDLVSVLPNPFYIRELRPLTGRDEAVAQYLQAQPEVGQMIDQIEAFLRHWLPALKASQRSYLTVALGCTGGQHRSVFAVQSLARRFAGDAATLVRHRELDVDG